MGGALNAIVKDQLRRGEQRQPQRRQHQRLHLRASPPRRLLPHLTAPSRLHLSEVAEADGVKLEAEAEEVAAATLLPPFGLARS